jgi:hypothetical protein
MKRAAIPIMVNNSLLSEVYCQNNGQAPNRNKNMPISIKIKVWIQNLKV